MGIEEPGRSRRILLVEDDRNHRWVMKRILETSFGDEVIVEEAENGACGLERATQRPTPDLILLDLGLPDMDGLEVLRRLRADPRTKALPIVVLTSSQEREHIRLAYENGANSFVSKSETPEKTFQRLRMLPVYWLELNRLPDDQSFK
jgi:two-component system, response regulator